MSFFSSMIWIALSFLFFTVMVAVISAWKTRDDKLDTAEGYFLAGRGLPGIVIAGSLLLTNLSAEQLVGTNGQGWASNMSPIGWEVGALFTLFALALWFLPTYLKMGTTTIPQLMEARFGRGTKLMFSFVIVVMYSILNLPVILYSGAVVFENIFDISGIFGISKFQAVAILCVVIGIIGGCYAIFGGLKAVAVSDTINGIGLIIGGLMIPFLALALLGHETTGGGLVEGVKYLVQAEPEKLNAWASWDAAEPALPWPLIFTGMFFNNLYWWCTNQSFVQRALAAKSLKEGQKGAIYCGFLKTIGFFYLVLPGVIAYHLPSIQDKLAAAGSSAIDFAYPALVSRRCSCKSCKNSRCTTVFDASPGAWTPSGVPFWLMWPHGLLCCAKPPEKAAFPREGKRLLIYLTELHYFSGIRAAYSLIFSKLSALMTCSTRQASSAAVSGETPKRIRQSVNRR